MMELVVLHGDREERVQVRRKEGQFAIQVGDREYSVDAVEVGPDHHSLRIGDDQYEVSIHRETGRAANRDAGVERYTIGGADGKLSANPGGDLVEVIDPLTHLAHQTLGGAGAGGRQQVTAYMPGRVVAILKAEGDPVETGEGVVVLEAMKMENEIQAESSGTLSKVLVKPGQAVDAGDPLFEIT
jgi:biotin carboxyl carrier protein